MGFLDFWHRVGGSYAKMYFTDGIKKPTFLFLFKTFNYLLNISLYHVIYCDNKAKG